MAIQAVVVDDDLGSAHAIGRLLEQAGCCVSIWTDPEPAIAAALEAGVDVVSLDIKMPRLNGFEVLSLIRSHEHTRRAPSVPVIAITGDVSDADKAHAIASGFAAHLGKPVTYADLQAVLGHVEALRGDSHRARYTSDESDIAGRLDHLLSSADAQASTAITGLALAMEQQGAKLLCQMLISAYGGDFETAADDAARLADVGEAIGAQHFAFLCGRFIEALGVHRAPIERQAVLARAELDRIVYTLRERVLA